MDSEESCIEDRRDKAKRRSISLKSIFAEKAPSQTQLIGDLNIVLNEITNTIAEEQQIRENVKILESQISNEENELKATKEKQIQIEKNLTRLRTEVATEKSKLPPLKALRDWKMSEKQSIEKELSERQSQLTETLEKAESTISVNNNTWNTDQVIQWLISKQFSKEVIELFQTKKVSLLYYSSPSLLMNWLSI
jgi:hypothetical protein